MRAVSLVTPWPDPAGSGAVDTTGLTGPSISEALERGAASSSSWGDGQTVRPLRRRPLKASVLLERWRQLPHVDPDRLREDVDGVADPSL